jgi:hypothetical protein
VSAGNPPGPRRRRNRISGQFAPRLIEMIESPAFCELSLSARRVLDRLEIELAGHGGTENGKLVVTFNQFQQYGIDRHAIAPALREVEALGFVEVTEHGRAGNAEYRQPNRFRITYRPTDNGPETHEWRRVKTTKDAIEIARTARNPKKNPSGGKRTVSVGKTHTETDNSQWGKPTLQS